MDNLDSFTTRIDSVLNEERQKILKFQQEQLELFHQRQARLAQYEKAIGELIPAISPRLRLLAERFKDDVNAKPIVRAHTRELVMDFRSGLAKITLKFSAFPDKDVQNIVFQYNLEIIPVLLQYDSQATLSQPLDKLDQSAVIKWIDDRIVDFIKTYVSIYENNYYLQGQRVEDPITGISFPKHFAACRLEWEGQTYYFISPETLAEFEKQHGIAPKGASA